MAKGIKVEVFIIARENDVSTKINSRKEFFSKEEAATFVTNYNNDSKDGTYATIAY